MNKKYFHTDRKYEDIDIKIINDIKNVYKTLITDESSYAYELMRIKHKLNGLDFEHSLVYNTYMIYLAFIFGYLGDWYYVKKKDKLNLVNL